MARLGRGIPHRPLITQAVLTAAAGNRRRRFLVSVDNKIMYAKLSTDKTIVFGPVLDSAGAAFTTEVVASVLISKNGAAAAALNGSATLTHSSVGVYRLLLKAADISEVGEVTVFLSNGTYAAAPVRLNVVPATVYDAIITNAVNATGGLVGATGTITTLAGVIATSTNITAATGVTLTATTGLGNQTANITGTITTATNLTTNNDKAGYTLTATTGLGNQTANITGTITTATNVTTVNGLAANVITAASIAADAITDAKVAADVTIASVTGAVGSIATGGIAAASFAAGAINAAAIATDAIGSDEIAATAVTKIQTGLATPTNITAGTITTATNVTTVNGLAAGVITAASIATDAIDADALATDAVTEINATVLSAISGIGTAGGAAINTDATTDNASGGISGVTSGTTKVGTQTGTFANTSNVNSTYHQITHATNAIDWVYQFLTGGGTSVVETRWTGYLDGINDTITFYAWNHVGAAWESLGTQVGQAGTTNVVKNLTLYARHSGTSAAELGKVYIRLACTGQTSPILYTDQLFVSYAVTSRSVGYANGEVWIDTVDGVAGTESFVNGVADNPVLTLADALTIATAVNLRNFEIDNGSSITLASTTANKVFHGHEWTLALGGQNIASSMFIDASVSGTASGSAAEFETCEIQTASVADSNFHNCAFNATLTLNAAGDYMFADCYSHVAGTGAPVFDFTGAGTKTASFRRWSGGMTLNNISSSHTVSIDCVSGGTITLNGADGNVQVRGMCSSVVDNRTGSPTLGTNAVINQTLIATPTNITAGTITTTTNLTNLPAITANWLTAAGTDTTFGAEIADAVWDEAIAGHLSAGSTGLALNSAGSAGDPWSTALPGAYGAGTAGEILGDWKNAGRLDLILDIIAADTTTDIPALIAAEAVKTAAIKVKTDFLPSVTAGAAGGVFIAGANAATSITTALTANIIGNITGNLSGSIGSYTGDTPQTGDSFARIGALGAGLTALATQTSVNTIDDFLDTEIAAIQTAVVTTIPAQITALNNLSSAAAATAVLTTQMTESYATDGVAPTLAQSVFLIQQALTEFAIVVNTGAGTSTTTIKKIDGIASAATLTLNSETVPTSATRAT